MFKKIYCLLISLVCTISLITPIRALDNSEEIGLSAQYAVAIDANSGLILYNKNISLKNTYEPITNKILNNIKLEIKSEENLIKKLRKYRSKNLAHNDIKSQNIELFVWEIDDLFKKTQKRLNTISSKIYKNTWRPLWTDTETEDCVYHIINKLKK